MSVDRARVVREWCGTGPGLTRRERRQIERDASGLGGGAGAGGRSANMRVAMTCVPAAGLVPTIDPSDVAHDVRDDAGMLVPGTSAGHAAQPRRYPACHVSLLRIVLPGGVEAPLGLVGIDTVFDSTHRRERALEGVILRGPAVHQAVARALDRLTPTQRRTLTRGLPGAGQSRGGRA